MKHSIRKPVSVRPDWMAILQRIPPDVQRTHHGRTPEEGFDCVGLAIWAYGQAGIQLADLEYAASEADQLNRNGAIALSLQIQLQEITRLASASLDRDGDLWLLDVGNGLVHAGIYCRGSVWHMGEKLHRRNAQRVRARMMAAFRAV